MSELEIPIYFGKFPAEEVAIERHLGDLLYDLDEYAEDFACAVSLFRHSCDCWQDLSLRPVTKGAVGYAEYKSAKERYWRWRHVAARDAAMTVYHFGRTLAAVRSEAGKISCIEGYVDPNCLRKAVHRFDVRFPHAVILRHAVAHRADNRSSLIKAKAIGHPHGALERESFGGFSMFTDEDYDMDTFIMRHRPRVDRPVTEMILRLRQDTTEELQAIKLQDFSAFSFPYPV